MTVSYDSVTMTGVIALSSTVVRDKLRRGVSDAVKDASQNLLDGDSNASAGGLLDFRFNVLVGDATNDGSINGGDLPVFASRFNQSLPIPEPGSLAFPSPPSFIDPQETSVPQIDAFFGELDDEDELELLERDGMM